jgi:hypothetical protein
MPANRLTPTERRLAGQIAAHESWARTENRSARTAPARQAALDKFERQVDPDQKLLPAVPNMRARRTSRVWH